MKVVSFKDDQDNAEGPLTSDAYPAGSATITAGTTCAEVWCATLTVQNLGGGHRGCANSVPGKECSNTSHLTEDEFTHDGTGYAVTSVQVRSGGELRLFLNPDLTTATQSLVLLVGAERFAFADAVTQGVNYRYWNNTGLSWTSGDVVELKLAESTTTTTNTPATGKPKISGAAQVGRTLTAAIGTIADADGLPSSFTYQWVRVDGGAERNIAGATSKTYRLVQADAGKTFKVKVSFTDDAGNREGPLTSNEYPASGVKGELRLMNDNGPTTTGEGRLEVFFRGEWGTVCDDRFGRPFRPNPKDREAPMVDSVAPQFACRLMGYATGAVVSRAGLGITSVSPEPEDGGPKIWLDDVLCKPAPTNWTGSTPRGLQHCHHAGWGLENCTHDEDVHLECTGALGQGEPAWMWGTAAQEAAEEALTAAFEDAPSEPRRVERVHLPYRVQRGGGDNAAGHARPRADGDRRDGDRRRAGGRPQGPVGTDGGARRERSGVDTHAAGPRLHGGGRALHGGRAGAVDGAGPQRAGSGGAGPACGDAAHGGIVEFAG